MRISSPAAGLAIAALLAAPARSLAGGDEAPPKPAASLDELRQQLEQVLADTRTPGLSIAVVRPGEPEWVAGLGKADLATGRAATAETLFRIGSTSKAFTALAVLALVQEGRIALDVPVRSLAPEVWFENRWEATAPVRVVHLLEHTTGWDDMHLREYAGDGAGMALREAFDYDHSSRRSRWPPGTRVAYCNSGPAVAAYLVEKVSGERFEDFVRRRFFEPIGMRTATFFQPEAAAATVLYHADGATPFPYWNVIFRPAGSVNASARDMARYLRFYLGRGTVDGRVVLPAASLDRMEVPASGWAAQAGLRAGYGLHNYWSLHDGLVFHGHNGGVPGGLTELAYLPDQGAGYSFSINSEHEEAFERIGRIVRAYLTRDLPRPAPPPPAALPAFAADYQGWYQPDSPRAELLRPFQRLLGLTRLRVGDGQVVAASLRDLGRVYLPVAGRTFRGVPGKEAPEPVATMALLEPNAEGRFVQLGGVTLRRIPGWLAVGEIAATAFVLLALVSVLLYAPFWLLGGLSRRRRRPAERALRGWPLLATLSPLLAFVLVAVASEDAFTRLAVQTGWSWSVFLLTLAFPVASAASAAAAWRARGTPARAAVRIHSTVVAVALLVASAYFLYWGTVGLRTWA